MTRRRMVAFFSERNMVRSIIAEAYLKRHGKEFFDCISFGIAPNRIHYLVYEILRSRGFNLNYSFSKRYEVVERQPIDVLVVMHPDLEKKLPAIPYQYEKEVWEFEDPTLSDAEEDVIREELQKLCDAIERKVKDFIEKHKPVAVSATNQ